MEYTVVKDTEWTYPDIFSYKTGGNTAVLHTARNSYACGQILLRGIADGAPVRAYALGDLDRFETEWYELVPVYIEGNLPELGESGRSEYLPCREAPYFLYDCAKPLGASLSTADGTAGLYFSIKIPDGMSPGEYSGTLRVECDGETAEIPARMTVYAATVPKEENLKIINGYNGGKTREYHGVTDEAEGTRLDGLYLSMLRRMRQNMLYVGGVRITDKPGGGRSFDFSVLEKNVEFYLSLGYKYFNMSSVGGRKSWKESTILVNGMPAMSYEAYKYLSEYLPALQAFLDGKGWTDMFYMGVADEPNDANATEFRALCGLVRKFAPRIKLLDALSYTAVHGALDVWVPLNAEYDKHMAEFEGFRVGDDEIWMYVCCGPRGEKYINRLMDYPLLSTRYLFWGNFKYNLGGYLHWASNCYQPGQDPFKQNCPQHTNADSTCTLPPGDSHIIYPGAGEPWMSLRLEAQRASAEDFELLCIIAQEDRAKADAICEKGFKSFKDVEYDPVKFEEIRVELLKSAGAQ